MIFRAGGNVIGTGYGNFAAPLHGRDAGFFMFIAVVSIFCWGIVIATTIMRHSAKQLYKKSKKSKD